MVLEAAGTSLTSVHFYQTTRRHIPEYSNFHCHRSETEISLRRGYYIKLGKYEKNGDKEVQFLSFNEEEWSVSVFERFYTREKGPLLNRRLCGPTEPVSTFRERQISSCYTTCAWHILLQYKLQLGYEIWSFCHTSSEKNIQIWQQGSKWRTEKITKWGTSWLCSQRV